MHFSKIRITDVYISIIFCYPFTLTMQFISDIFLLIKVKVEPIRETVSPIFTVFRYSPIVVRDASHFHSHIYITADTC